MNFNHHDALSETQLIDKLEVYTTKYLNLMDNSAELVEQHACKKLLDDIVEEFTKRKYAA